MSPMIEIRTSDARRAEVEALLTDVPNGAARALTRAINQVAAAVRTDVVRRVAATITVTQAELRRRNVILRRANWENLRATVRVTGSRIPLERFAARQTRKGVGYAIRRGGGREMIPSAFIGRTASGHRGVYLRRMRGDRRAPRLPIDEKFGPSVPHVVEGIGEFAAAAMDGRLGDDLERQIDTQVGLLLERRAGGGR